MSSLSAARAAYGVGQVITADPVRLILDCYDAIVADFDLAADALADADVAGWVTRVTHAQDLINELYKGLHIDAWDGGPALAQVYMWSLRELPRVMVAKDAVALAAHRAMYADLRDAWKAVITG